MRETRTSGSEGGAERSSVPTSISAEFRGTARVTIADSLGVALRPEIKPAEPDPVCTGVGKAK